MRGTLNFTDTEIEALTQAITKVSENQICDFMGERAGLASAKKKILEKRELIRMRRV